MSKIKPIPKFKTEDEERDFWDSHDVTEYMEVVSQGENLFPNLKPSTQTISLRLPENLLNKIKTEANKRDMPYQSLMKYVLHQSFYKSSKSKKAV